MKKLLKRFFKSSRTPPIQAHCPPGERIYCIGDIHGRHDLLQQLHTNILNHAATYTGRKKLIYLGDYIDRGDHSKEVIEVLLSDPLHGFDIVYLRGNHEQTLLDFLHEPEVGRSWFNYGGLQTLVSYGVRYSKLPTSPNDLLALQADLRTCMPQSHVRFLEQTGLSYVVGSYYFVHAGVSPRLRLDQQQAEDQLWIRDAFIEHTRPYEKIIVHGHTITEEVDFQANRIGLDTGAYLSGKLTCLVLEDDQQELIQTRG